MVIKLKLVSYTKIKENLKEIVNNNGIVFVVKDDAYNFKISKIVPLAIDVGIKEFAVIDINDAIKIRNIDNNIDILLLANGRNNINIIKKYNLIPTIENVEEYNYYSNNDIKMALKIDVGMHRFGFNRLFNKYLFDENIIEIYFHLPYYDKSYNSLINDYICILDSYNKKYHFGGSILYHRNYPLRFGIIAYENSIKYYGRILKVNTLKAKGSLGYNASYKSNKDMKYAVIDVGYYNGLPRNFKYRVFYNGKYYNSLGILCMNHMFIEADDNFIIDDYVEIIGDNCNILDIVNDNNYSLYELLLNLK